MPRMLGLLVLLAGVALGAAGCGGSTEPSAGEAAGAMRVAASEARLRSLLREHGVPLEAGGAPGAESLRQAWAAFADFAREPVSARELEDDPSADALLFELGTFDFGAPWGETFQLSFVRQFTLPDGELRQAHLVAHLPAEQFGEVMSRVGVRTCAADPACATRCFSAGRSDFVGTGCVLRRRARASEPDGRFASALAWSYDTAGATPEERRESWIALVGRSPVLRLAFELGRPLGYEVWFDATD